MNGHPEISFQACRSPGAFDFMGSVGFVRSVRRAVYILYSVSF